MKSLSMAASLIAAGFALQAARAADNPPARDFRAAATDGASAAPVVPAASPGPDCGVERLSLIWGPDRQPGAYECLGRLNSP